MFADVLRFWFDRGVEGFRVDAIWPVGKDPALPDQPRSARTRRVQHHRSTTPCSAPRATRCGGVAHA